MECSICSKVMSSKIFKKHMRFHAQLSRLSTSRNTVQTVKQQNEKLCDLKKTKQAKSKWHIGNFIQRKQKERERKRKIKRCSKRAEIKDVKRQKMDKDEYRNSDTDPQDDVDFDSGKIGEDKHVDRSSERNANQGHISEDEGIHSSSDDIEQKKAGRVQMFSDDDTDTDIDTLKIPTDFYVEESSSEEEFDDEEIVKDRLKPGIFVLKVVKSHTSKLGKFKRKDRVYNAKHYCDYCKKLVLKWARHINTHKDLKEVKEILETVSRKDRKRKFDRVRRYHDHKHNLKVLKAGKGLLILGRRVNDLDVAQYGPCPNCFEWLKKRNLIHHIKQCPGSRGENDHESIGSLVTQCDILMGNIKEEASAPLLSEVLPSMLLDETGRVARQDPLILLTGSQWYQKNEGNTLRRANMTSSFMRLNAKLLINMREVKQLEPEGSFSDYLRPQHFDVVVEGVLRSSQWDDAVEEFVAPSNSIKLGHAIKMLLAAKKGVAIRQRNEKIKSECVDFLDLMRYEWNIRVTKLAKRILNERKFNEKKELPLPDDVKKLTLYLDNQLSELDVTPDNYRRAVQLTLAKLIVYNKRRSGEVQAITLKSYGKRTTGTSELEQTLTGKLTNLEQHLLKTQDVMEVRGKLGRGVPVIIPSVVKGPLAKLADPAVRIKAGVHHKNNYLFAAPNNRLGSVMRGYECINRCANEAKLQFPGRMTSVSLRKYIATVSQVLNLSDKETKWLFNHLGHTEDVHLLHYRSTSESIERIEIAKLCIMVDNNLVRENAGKSLEDIDIRECVYTEEHETTTEPETAVKPETTVKHETAEKPEKPLEEEDIEFYNDEDLDDFDFPKKTVKKTGTRTKWTEPEVNEMQRLFGKFIQDKRCPTKKEILMKLRKAKYITRDWETVKKKVWNTYTK